MILLRRTVAVETLFFVVVPRLVILKMLRNSNIWGTLERVLCVVQMSKYVYLLSRVYHT